MDINDSYYPNALNDFPIVTSHKWMNGLNKALHETTNLVKKAEPLVHCCFAWCRTCSSEQSLPLTATPVCVKLT